MAKRSKINITGWSSKQLLNLWGDLLMEHVEPDWIDMNNWASKGFKRHLCGSTACAAGWAATLMPSMLKLRLSYSRKKEHYDVCFDGNMSSNSQAIADAFGISRRNADYITMPYGLCHDCGKKIILKTVVAKIREIAEELDDVYPAHLQTV